VTFELTEFASWDALTYTPDKQFELASGMKALLEKETGISLEVKDAIVAGAPGFAINPASKGKVNLQVRMAWNRYQRRTLMVLCVDVKCDAAVESVKWAAPAAE
jgi:hypothetical protein